MIFQKKNVYFFLLFFSVDGKTSSIQRITGVTTMLNFFTTSNGFRSTLPVVSNLTAMNVWDGVCMCFIYASLLEFVCVNYVGRKRPLHNVVYRPGENPVTQVMYNFISARKLPSFFSAFYLVFHFSFDRYISKHFHIIYYIILDDEKYLYLFYNHIL